MFIVNPVSVADLGGGQPEPARRIGSHDNVN